MRHVQKPLAGILNFGSSPNLAFELEAQSDLLVFLIPICSISLPSRIVAFFRPLSGLRLFELHVAHIIRAILLANAITTSIFGFRAAILSSHEPCGKDVKAIEHLIRLIEKAIDPKLRNARTVWEIDDVNYRTSDIFRAR